MARDRGACAASLVSGGRGSISPGAAEKGQAAQGRRALPRDRVAVPGGDARGTAQTDRVDGVKGSLIRIPLPTCGFFGSGVGLLFGDPGWTLALVRIIQL